MREVIMEVQSSDGPWTRVGSLGEVEPPGSISGDGPLGQRRVLMFGWLEGVPGVWESSAGADVETEAVRAIASLGFEQLSDLAEPYEATIVRRGTPMRVRFTLRG